LPSEREMESALDIQSGGIHYKDCPIQPGVFCHVNQLPYFDAAAVKYIFRHKAKGKAADIKKAIHCLQLILELDYNLKSKVTYAE